MIEQPNKGASANRRAASQSSGSGNLSAIGAAGRAFPVAFADLSVGLSARREMLDAKMGGIDEGPCKGRRMGFDQG